MTGDVLVPGAGTGSVVTLEEALSLWGGFDPTSGAIIDRRHPQRGCSLSGRVLVMPSGRGSSSSSSVLAEALRAGTAPAAIVLRRPDPIVALGALVAAELYGTSMPVVVSDTSLADGEIVRIEAGDGGVTVTR